MARPRYNSLGMEVFTIYFRKIIAAIFAALLLLTACSDRQAFDRVDESVMPAWEGDYSVQHKKEAIEQYRKKYIPIYVVNLNTSKVSFEVDFTAVSCGSVILTPVDDATKGAELNTIVDFSGEASVDNRLVTVDIMWWYNAPANVQTYKVWSYLFWVKDTNGVAHYYYFRVDYTA